LGYNEVVRQRGKGLSQSIEEKITESEKKMGNRLREES